MPVRIYAGEADARAEEPAGDEADAHAPISPIVRVFQRPIVVLIRRALLLLLIPLSLHASVSHPCCL